MPPLVRVQALSPKADLALMSPVFSEAWRQMGSKTYDQKGAYGAMPDGRTISRADAIRRQRAWCGECGHHVEKTMIGDGEVIEKCKCRRVA
jgi:formamidopyrimidine-DNA glycosylase